jgi:two-component system NtrC family sensor kinase
MTLHRSIRFMTTPAFGEVKEHVRAELLAKALSNRLGHPVSLEPVERYEQLLEALEKGEADAVWGTAELCDRFAPQAHAVLRAVRSGTCGYHAAFVCRSDDPLRLDALGGTAAAWVTRWSTAGYLLPRTYLRSNGIDPDQVLGEQREHGSYRLALQAVLDGEADFATIYCTLPDERAVHAALAEHVGPRASELTAFAFTRATASDGVLVTRRLPQSIADRLVEALVDLGSGGSGILPHLGLFDTEGFAVDGQVPAPAERRRESSSALALLELNAEGVCKRAWSASGMLHGRPCASLEGKTLQQALGAEAATPLSSLVADAFRTGRGGRLELLLEVEGSTRWFLAEVTLAAGRPEACLLLRDVSDTRLLEEELFHLASWPLLSPDPALEIDRNGRLRYANRAAHSLFPGLVGQGADHPIIAALLAVGRSPSGRRSVLHEVVVDGRRWLLAAVVAAHAEYVRGTVVDVSDASTRRPTLRSLGGR